VCNLLTDHFRGGGAHRVFDAETLSASALEVILSGTQNLSLFGGTQLVVIRRVEALNAALTTKLSEHCARESLASTFILVGTPLPATNPLRKRLASLDLHVDIPELVDADLQKWVAKELRTAGIPSASGDVVAKLISLSDGNPDRIIQMIEHVALFVDSDTVTVSDLGTLFAEALDPNEFKLTDYLADRNALQTERYIGSLLASGKNSFLMLSLIYRTFSNYLSIKHLTDRGVSGPDLARQVGGQPWLVTKQAGAARKISYRMLKNGVESVLRADSKLKNKALGAEEILGELTRKTISA
jgi:DNA polymerase III delta subunit